MYLEFFSVIFRFQSALETFKKQKNKASCEMKEFLRNKFSDFSVSKYVNIWLLNLPFSRRPKRAILRVSLS